MRFTLVAVAAGLLIGVLTGGRLRHLGDRDFSLLPLLVSGVALQAVGSQVPSGLGLFMLLVSYMLLLAFAAANASLVGMWLVALGIGLNFVVIAANGGMPVRPSALVAAGIAEPGEFRYVELGAKRHLERPSDRLTAIADAYPLRPLGEVLSFGDIVLNVGVANVVVHLLRPQQARHARRPETPGGPDDMARRENGARAPDRRPPLVPAWLPRRRVDGGGQVGVGAGAAGLQGDHRRR